MKTLLAWAIGLAFAGGVAAAEVRPRPEVAPEGLVAEAPGPALWLLSDEDTKIYLFGTIHVLPPDFAWRSPQVDHVIEEADELVLEITRQDMEDSMNSLVAQVMMSKQVPLEQRVSPERRPALRRMIQATGIPAVMLDSLHTWAATMLLDSAHAMQMGTKNRKEPEFASGVEEVLTEAFEQQEKPVSGVETAQMQIGFFSKLPLNVQRSLLEQTVDAFADGMVPMDAVDRDWVNGDVDAIGQAMEVFPPELFTILLTERNRRWTDWLVERLEQPGTVLFAVGAGHLAGRDSVQSMLHERGLQVTRLR